MIECAIQVYVEDQREQSERTRTTSTGAGINAEFSSPPPTTAEST
jgi:hypothetical protein